MLLIIDMVLINAAFLLAFLVRYGIDIPEVNFLPYKKSFTVLTLIYISALSCFKVYKKRFKSSWDLFSRIFMGLSCATLLSITFIYIFRVKLGAFPTSIFASSFLINLLLIFKLNRGILKSKKKIKKNVVVIGQVDIDDVLVGTANIEKMRSDQIEELIQHRDIDEIVICEKIRDEKVLSILIYFVQKLRIDVYTDFLGSTVRIAFTAH
jgi:FlaA1/EpsC-like NDP-sugar epimerase